MLVLLVLPEQSLWSFNMYALISEQELVETGYRVVEIRSEPFDMGNKFKWIECADTVVPNEVYYDPVDSTIKLLPIPEIYVKPPKGGTGVIA